jgi:hypothetical protein
MGKVPEGGSIGSRGYDALDAVVLMLITDAEPTELSWRRPWWGGRIG